MEKLHVLGTGYALATRVYNTCFAITNERGTLLARLLYEAAREADAQAAAEGAMRQMEAFFERRTYLRKYVLALRVMACPVKMIRGKSRWQVTLKIVDQPVCQEAVGKMSEIAQTPLEGIACVCQVNPSSMM